MNNFIKKLFLLLLAFSTLNVMGQDSNLFTKMDMAKSFAAENEVNIMLVFAGSDWCKPCMKFKKNVLEDEAFITYAKDNLAILYLDFPARKANKLSDEETKHNEDLAEKYNRSGSFPKIVLLDENLLNERVMKYNGEQALDFIELLK